MADNIKLANSTYGRQLVKLVSNLSGIFEISIQEYEGLVIALSYEDLTTCWFSFHQLEQWDPTNQEPYLVAGQYVIHTSRQRELLIYDNQSFHQALGILSIELIECMSSVER